MEVIYQHVTNMYRCANFSHSCLLATNI